MNLTGAGQTQRRFRQRIQPLLRDLGTAARAVAIGSGGNPGKRGGDLPDLGASGLAHADQNLVTFTFGGLLFPIRRPWFRQGTADLPQPCLQLPQPGLQGLCAVRLICHIRSLVP